MDTETIKNETPETQEGKVGTMLHDVRIKKKLSIDTIAQELRIKAAYLTAIEQSDYDNIPAAPYGIGFVRSYASYLGLNSARIVQIFKEETNVKDPKPLLVETSETEEKSEQEEIYTPNSKYILISLAMFVLGYLLWSTFNDSESTVEETNSSAAQTEVSSEEYPLQVENFVTETEQEVEETPEAEQITVTSASFVETTETPAAENKTTEKTEVKESTPAPTDKVESQSSKPGRVLLKVNKETWIEVKDDNKLWISKVMPAGSEYTVPDNGNGKTVSFGNTDGVDVIIDGKVVTVVSKNKKTNIKLDAFLGNH